MGERSEGVKHLMVVLGRGGGKYMLTLRVVLTGFFVYRKTFGGEVGGLTALSWVCACGLPPFSFLLSSYVNCGNYFGFFAILCFEYKYILRFCERYCL